MVLNVNFPFETFMNKTDDIYANDLKISSLYLYDWNDKNEDNDVASDELSMINRGGSWGTVQEIRITQPNEKFEHTPLVGLYPVPTRYSYWIGDTQKNSTSIDYTLSSSYYKKAKWDVIWTSADSVNVPPNSSSQESKQTTIQQKKICFIRGWGVWERSLINRSLDHRHVVDRERARPLRLLAKLKSWGLDGRQRLVINDRDMLKSKFC